MNKIEVRKLRNKMKNYINGYRSINNKIWKQKSEKRTKTQDKFIEIEVLLAQLDTFDVHKGIKEVKEININ